MKNGDKIRIDAESVNHLTDTLYRVMRKLKLIEMISADCVCDPKDEDDTISFFDGINSMCETEDEDLQMALETLWHLRSLVEEGLIT